MIKGRKGTTAMADRAVNNRRRLEVNHQKRELRRQAMQAVRQINRRQLQTGAVGRPQCILLPYACSEADPAPED